MTWRTLPLAGALFAVCTLFLILWQYEHNGYSITPREEPAVADKRTAESDDYRIPLRRMGFANGASVQFDTFVVNSSIFPERKEQTDGGKFELYDVLRFVEVVFTRNDGRGGRQVRYIPWTHVAWVAPMDDGKASK